MFVRRNEARCGFRSSGAFPLATSGACLIQPSYRRGDAMGADDHRDDVQAIEAVIARQFASLSWMPGTSADWDGFAADFFPEASLYPAARPAKRQTVEGFIER